MFPPLRSMPLAIALLLTVPSPQPASAQHGHNAAAAIAAATNCPVVATLIPFLDPLPIPPPARPARTNLNYCVPVATNLCFASIPEYDMPMTEFLHSFHTNLPPVPV